METITPSTSILASPWLDRLGLRPGRARTVGLALLGAAIFLTVLSLSAFASPAAGGSGWTLHFMAIGAWAAAFYILFPAQVRIPVVRRETWIGLLLILGLAAFMRLYRFDALPMGTWIDEADNGVWARQILNDPNFRPVYLDSTHLPAHFVYLVALAFKVFGEGTLAVRAVTVAFGLGSVLLAFIVGREAHGERLGLVFAFLFAVSHWAVNFSRVGLHGMSTPFFILLILYFLLRAHHTGGPHSGMWAGLTLGVGLSFYAGFRPFAAVVAAYAVYELVIGYRKRKEHPFLPRVINLSALALSTLLTVAPVAQYALARPEDFWSRTNEVSIFNRRDESNLTAALRSNVTRHLLMFNYHGDNNGRHNLPGEPMLDPLTGALAVLGLALVVSRPLSLGSFLFLLTFVTGLAGGILTLDFEAPQSLRAIGSMPAVLYFAACAVEAMWRGLVGPGAGPRRLAGAAVMAVAALYVGQYNYDVYFVKQANHTGAWESFNAVETLTARHMREFDREQTTFYVSMYFNNHLVIRFLAPEITDGRTIQPPDILPVREPGDKQVVMFVDSEIQWVAGIIRQYYPNATVIEDRSPEGVPMLYTIIIPPQDITRIQGLTASYWAGDEPQGSPQLTQVDKTIHVDWPVSTLALPYVAEWTGILSAPTYGVYEFVLDSPSEATLWLDEQLVSEGTGTQNITFKLARGNHLFRLRARGGQGRVRLQWRPPTGESFSFALEDIQPRWLYLAPPVNNHGLLGRYYPNDSWSGEPQIERIDPFLSMYFHLIPLGRPYTVDWVGQINAPVGGDYAFGLRINGKAEVFLDDQLVVQAAGPSDYTEGHIHLTAGWHKIKVRYLDYLGGSRLHLRWIPPGASAAQDVPSEVLSPYP